MESYCGGDGGLGASREYHEVSGHLRGNKERKKAEEWLPMRGQLSTEWASRQRVPPLWFFLESASRELTP